MNVVPSISNVDIDVRPELLQQFALSEDDFYDALKTALDRLEGTPPQELPGPLHITLTCGGQEFRLGDLARVAYTVTAN